MDSLSCAACLIGVDGIRIGIADPWFWESCENGIGEIVRRAIDALARAGRL